MTTPLHTDDLTLQEQLSALHDGQLDAARAALLVRASLQDENLMLQWRSMSAISHVLHAQVALPETAQLSPTAAEVAPGIVPTTRQEAANDGTFRWKMVAGIAGFAAVGSLVWGLLGAAGSPGLQQGAALAGRSNNETSNAAVTLVNAPSLQNASQEQVMIRNPHLDELLAAHKQFGGISALQQPAGSLRSVSLSNTPAANSRP
jgi:sigma-E factor negative regulatory protein RseA